MTISTTESSIAYNGNGVTLAFAVPFRFFADANLTVILRSTAGVESPLVLNTNYTLTGADNDAGGTLTMVVAPAVGERLVIDRIVSITQETDYPEGGNFPAEAHERALDRLTMIGQQLQRSTSRCIQFPVSDTASPVIPTSTSRANKFLAFDAGGNATVAIPTSDSAQGLRFDLANNTDPLKGAGLIGWIRNAIGAIGTTVGKWLARQNVSLHDFMTDAQIADSLLATPVLDHTAAIQAFFAQMVSGKSYCIPDGQFRFNKALTVPYMTITKLYGEGRRNSVFRYFGASTTVDLLTFGSTSALSKMYLSGFSVESDTTMTAGTAIRMKKIGQGFTVRDVAAGTNGGNRKLWDGVWFDNASVGTYTHFENEVQNVGVIVNGAAGADEGSDIWYDYGLVQYCAIGFLIGGGFGGYYFNNIVAFGNGTNYKVDNSRVARRNREGFFSRHCVSDMCKAYGIHINDPLISNSYIQMDANIGSAGLVTPAAPGVGLYVQSFPNGRIHCNSAEIFNCVSDGVRTDDASCAIQFNPATYIFNNGGWGVNATNANSRVFLNNALFEVNTLGATSANLQNPGALSFTPVVTVQSGAMGPYTAACTYRLINGQCIGKIDINITGANTGVFSLITTLPKTARGYADAYGAERATTGRGLKGIAVNSNLMNITYSSDNAYPGANGNLLTISFNYDYQ